ncbi:MAG: hypothetical protein ACRDGU_01615 [Actinomycetota bacterium]
MRESSQSTSEVFLDPDGTAPDVGSIFRNPGLRAYVPMHHWIGEVGGHAGANALGPLK